MKWYRKGSFILAVLLLLVLQAQAQADKQLAEKPVISRSEFMRYVATGQTVENFIIPSQYIIDCLSSPKHYSSKATNSSRLNIENCIIRGHVRLNRKTVHIPIMIEWSQFTEDVSLSRIIFNKYISMAHTTFYGEVDCSRLVFKDWTLFDDSVFTSEFQMRATDFAHVIFARAKFHKNASFFGSHFGAGATFDGAVFDEDADFDKTAFTALAWKHVMRTSRPSEEPSSTFHSVKFAKMISFIDMTLEHTVLAFRDTIFGGPAFFTNVDGKQAGKLAFVGAHFKERVSFDGSAFDLLTFYLQSAQSLEKGNELDLPRRLPVVFEEPVSFQSLKCKKAQFGCAQFRSYADFSYATFSEMLAIWDTVFEGEVDFEGTNFPSSQEGKGLYLHHVRFRNPVFLKWQQMVEHSPWWRFWEEPRTKVVTFEVATWNSLERVFDEQHDLEGRNGTIYQRRLLALLDGAVNENPLLNLLSRQSWGYGFRPIRLFGWVVLSYLFFTFAYWTETRPMLKCQGSYGGRWGRVWYAMAFSLNTSWKPFYGYKNSKTMFFKVLTIIHSVLFKLMFVLLAYAITNVSPLLSEITRKTIGF